jgi:uncharacterized protein (TIGR03437 family)
MHARIPAVLLAVSLLGVAQPLTFDLTTVPTNIAPQSLVAGDFNHDSKPDLAVTGKEGSVAILLGNGDGTFRSGQTIPVGAPATRIVKADFNHDGNFDLAVSVGSTGQVVVLLGNADGTFQAPIDSGMRAPGGVFTPGNNPMLMAADINGDGKTDLIVGPYSMASASVSLASSSTMYVLAGNGDGTFQAPVVSSIKPVAYSTAVAVDFFHDGKTEVFLVGTHSSYPNSSLLTGAAGGSLTETLFAALSNDVDAFYPVTLADATGNSRPAVVVVEPCSSGSAPGIFTFPDGSLTPVTSAPDYCPSEWNSIQAVAADVDGDGKPDLLLSDATGDLYVLTGKGDGTFLPTSPTRLFYTGASRSDGVTEGYDVYGSLTTADFRGSGKQDVIVALTGKRVVLLKNGTAIPPNIPPPGVVSSATLSPVGAVAGSLMSIFGTGLAYETAAPNPLYPLPDRLFGTSVTLNGLRVPFLWLSPNQANVQIPWEAAGLTQATLTLARNGAAASVTVQIAPQAPGLFTMNGQGTGQAAALIAGTASVAAPLGAFSSSRPARPGEYVSLYGTGLGPVLQPIPLVTGEATPVTLFPFQPFTNAYYPTIAKTTVTIGGITATVQFAGLAPAMIGVYQINVLVPANAPPGPAVPVVVSVGGVAAPAVTIAIGPS